MVDDFEKEKIRRLERAMYSRSLSRRLRTRARKVLKPLSVDIPTDWKEKSESTAQMSVAPRIIMFTRSAMWWLLALAIGFFVISAAVFVYYFTFGEGGSAAAPRNIDIQVRGPISVVGGEVSKLEVYVTNRNNAALELADLIVTFPEGTRDPNDFVTDMPRKRIPLETIEPGDSRQGIVSAVFVGKEGEQEEILLEVEYRIRGSNAIFVADSTYEITFTSAPVAVSIEANDKAVSGQQMVLIAKVTPNVDTVLRDVVLGVEVPFGFTLANANPAPVADDIYLWEIGDIRPGDTYTLRLQGTMEGQAGDERVFRFNVGTRREKSSDSVDFVVAEGIHRVAIERPFIGLDVLVNGDSSDTVSVLPGETVNIAIPWVNNLPTAITNAVIVANMEGLPINGTTVFSTDGFYRSTDRSMLWDKATTKGVLGNLSPGQRGSVGFSFTVPGEVDLTDVRNAFISMTVHAAGKRISQTGVSESLQASASSEIKVGTYIEFVAQGFYYENPFGSVGPLPPKANEETTYGIVLTVVNTSNDVKNAKITAALPPYVRWLGLYAPAGERFTLNSNDGTIEWDIGTLKAGVGIGDASPRQVAFAIGLTPSESHIGQEPALVRDLRFSGSDAFTGKDVIKTHQSVTTNLKDDQGFSATESRVVAP